MDKPDREGRKAPPTINRLKWIAAIGRTWKEYSALQLGVASVLAWDFTDNTGETIVKPGTVAKHIGATLRPVSEAYALLRKDGWLERTTSAAPGRAARFRLTFPQTLPARAQRPEPAKAVAPPPQPKNVHEYVGRHLRYWRNVEDDDAFKARWAAEKQLRQELWHGDELSFNKAKAAFTKLLSERTSDPSNTERDDEDPF